MTHAVIQKFLPIALAIVTAGIVNFRRTAWADDTIPGPAKPGISRELAMKTLGGRQFWGDVFFFHRWRIQQNVFTGHFRLIDAEDYRHAAGDFEECLQKLEQIKNAAKIPPMSGKAVILLHGIIRSSKSMDRMREPLEAAGYNVFQFDYPSTRVPIQDAAKYLDRCIRSLEGIDEISFIVHSMGGLVVRSYLAQSMESGEPPDARLKRMVMLGVPNLGAQMADRVKNLGLFQAIFGPAGQQLISDPSGFVAQLPTPEFEFAIVAGGRGTINGYNPLIPGDDDGTVSVTSTRLPGAADFVLVPCLHSFMMVNAEIVDYSVRFITEGRLREEGEPHRIPKASMPDGQTTADISSTAEARIND